MTSRRTAGGVIAEELRHSWHALRFFEPQPSDAVPPNIIAAREIADGSHLPDHEFFAIARTTPDILRLWASQEAVVTNAFSQLLLVLATAIENVHLRTRFLDVIVGEHHVVRDGIADGSHPWLLHELCLSLGLNLSRVTPIEATIVFVEQLANALDVTSFALGMFGIGNERMLLHEYAAVEHCFEACMPTAKYRAFLRANINEDDNHCKIIEVVASAMQSASEGQYVEGARRGVDARIEYYDSLVKYWKEMGLPRAWLSPTGPHTVSSPNVNGYKRGGNSEG